MLSRGEAAPAASEKDLPRQLCSLPFSIFKQTQNPLVEITAICSRNVTVGWLGIGQKRRLIFFPIQNIAWDGPEGNSRAGLG